MISDKTPPMIAPTSQPANTSDVEREESTALSQTRSNLNQTTTKHQHCYKMTNKRTKVPTIRKHENAIDHRSYIHNF